MNSTFNQGGSVETNKRPWPITSTYSRRDKIDTNPDFQRPAVWTRAQKQLLIDTIIRGYDIPKLYWRKNGIKYEVVDGQQRLRAIWEFIEGKFGLPKNADLVGKYEIASMKYHELPDEILTEFETYPLDIVVLQEADEEEVREMFLRLQNGTTLKAQEKRNAMPGNMRNFVKSLVEHPFFLSIGFKNSRYAFDHVAAQMTLIEIEGTPCNIKDSNLNSMYEKHKKFDINGAIAKKTQRVLNFLKRAFPDKTPELHRYNVVSLYALVSHLLESYAVSDRYSEISKWFINFETWRREELKHPQDQCDAEVVIYHEKTSHSTDASDSISWRHQYLMRKLFESIPNIELKDSQRSFTNEQKLAIFRRDDSLCQVKIKCKGLKCNWDNWEADHKISWSNGGKTIVENGQVSCIECNRAKGKN